jgi:hypothetical protein
LRWRPPAARSLPRRVDQGRARDRTRSGALWLAASAAAAVCAAALRTGAALGTARGILYGAGDVATKAAAGAGPLRAGAPRGAYGLAFACLQLGFQRGRALGTIGPATLLTNSLPIAAGIVLFGEPAGRCA